MKRVTIVGEAPSKSSDPTRPFDGWSGRWLAKQAGLSGYHHLAHEALLVNVLRRWPGKGNAGEKGSRFPLAKARRAAKRMKLDGIVLLAGKRVSKVFGFDFSDYFCWKLRRNHEGKLVWFACIPHPSGCNRWWHYEENRKIARAFFRGLFNPIERLP